MIKNWHTYAVGGIMNESELSYLDDVFSKLTEELHQSLSKLNATPWQYHVQPEVRTAANSLTERSRRVFVRRAHAEDFIALEALGRVRLSTETRKAELKRLKRKYKKRKKYTYRYNRIHNKVRTQRQKARNESRWEKDPLTRLKYTSRKPVHITQPEWDKWIAPVWNQYDRKYLKIKGGDSKGYTVYNLILEYHPPKERYARKVPSPVVVYNGHDTAVYAAMNG